MSARQTLKKLTWPAKAAFALVIVLTCVAQILRWTLALFTEIAEELVAAGQAAQSCVGEAATDKTTATGASGAGARMRRAA